MSKTQVKAGALQGAAPKLTDEQKTEQLKRRLMAKREAIAQMCLSSLCQNPSAVTDERIVERSFEMAEAFVKAAYGYKVDFVKEEGQE